MSFDSVLVLYCPTCKITVAIKVNEINCAIFRHGVLKSNNKQIDPHATKEICDDLIINNKIYGCGKPFTLKKNKHNSWIAVKCGYI